MAQKHCYRVIFRNQDKLYELYAREIQSSNLLAFVEVSGLIFGEQRELVVDPTEEQLRSEFEGVDRIYLPAHAIIRIDRVEKEGHGKITSSGEKGTIMPFPVYTGSGPEKG
ncbi:MAG: DUF1820 family protein [Gammaproteobacteria bacterium]|nr:MAG: DUF1820 family protein [Gammaproteobacteria bacterium]